MSSLFGGKEAIARPKVKVKFKGSWDSENFYMIQVPKFLLSVKKLLEKFQLDKDQKNSKLIYSAVVCLVQSYLWKAATFSKWTF